MARLSADSWQALRAEYCTGLFSNRQLAEKYGISEGALRKRAGNEDWGKDLSQQVQAEINSRLLRAQADIESTHKVRTLHKVRTKEQEVVTAAARTGVEIITRHRKTIDRAQQITAKLLDRVEQAVESEEVDLTKQVIMLKELSNAAKNWTALERPCPSWLNSITPIGCSLISLPRTAALRRRCCAFAPRKAQLSRFN